MLATKVFGPMTEWPNDGGLSARHIRAACNESLRRLQTDHIDLLQHHEVIRFDDPDRIFVEGGAAEAIVEAQQAGKIRYTGFTGHKDPQMHPFTC